jgi:hypothetical protein
MTIKLKLSSGKEIELTLEELKELFGMQAQPVAFIPYCQTLPIMWPQATYTQFVGNATSDEVSATWQNANGIGGEIKQ